MQLGTKPSTISEAKKGLSSPLKGCFSDVTLAFVCSKKVSGVVMFMLLMVKPNISLRFYQNIVFLFKKVCHSLLDVVVCYDSIFFYWLEFFFSWKYIHRLCDQQYRERMKFAKKVLPNLKYYYIFFVFGNLKIFFVKFN